MTIRYQAVPVAVDDSFSFLPTVEQTTPNSLFANNGSGADTLGFSVAEITSFDAGSGAVAVPSGSSASTAFIGGTLTVFSDGNWTLTGQPFNTGTATFTYTITNSAGSSPATVTLMVGQPAVCTNDAYTATGNVSINTATSAGNDVLQNDTGNAISVTEVQGVGANVGANIATANSGTVNMTSAGEFTYDPPVGFTGNDTFTYTIDNASMTPSTCTVTVTVSDMIYFMDSSASAGGNGTLARPFQTIAEHNGAPPIANSFLYVEDNGSVIYSGNLQLVSGQTVIGEGATGTLFGAGSRTGITLAPLSVTVPSLTGSATNLAEFNNTGGNAITVNSNNTIVGIRVGLTSGYAFIDNGSSIGTLSIQQSEITLSGGLLNFTNGGTVNANFIDFSSSSYGSSAIILTNMNGTIASGGVTNTANADTIAVSGGAVNLTMVRPFTKSGGTGELLSVTNGHTGTLTFINSMTATSGSGLLFDNADGTYTFSSIVDINGTSAGVNIQNGSDGTFNVANTSSHIQGIQGIPFRINNSGMNVDYNGGITHRQGTSSLMTARVVEIIGGTGIISFDGNVIHGDSGNRGTAETVFMSNTGVGNTVTFNYVDSTTNKTSAFFSNTSGNVAVNRLRSNCQGDLTIAGNTHCIQISDTTSSGFTIEALSVDTDDGGENGGAISLVNAPGIWTIEDITAGLNGRFQTLVFGNNFGTLNIATVNSGTSPGAPAIGNLTSDNGGTIDLTNGTVNINVNNLNSFNSVDHGINLVDVDGPLFRVSGEVRVTSVPASNALINFEGVTVARIDIGTNGTTNNTVDLDDRFNFGISTDTNTPSVINFGNTSIQDPNGTGLPQVSNTGTVVINFASLTP